MRNVVSSSTQRPLEPARDLLRFLATPLPAILDGPFECVGLLIGKDSGEFQERALAGEPENDV